ncbi:MAG: carboxypeptidase regulatory-like domain-containing protein, partial [Bacteroidota bacterium]
MKKSFLLLIACLSLLTSQAQSFFFVGQVLNQTDGSEMAGAEVVLKGSSLETPKGAITDESGRFRIGPLNPGTFVFRIKMNGFAPIEKTLELPKDNFQKIQLDKAYELDAVDIKAEAPPAQQKGDTTEYNASAFTTNPDASTEDLVEKMPGVIINNGQVEAQGEKVQQVLVDGKPFFGTDPSAALKNLPAEVVDKIQVFDQQSEQAQLTGFDDGNTTKTINIVTKLEKRNGTFGRGYAGYGYEDKYKAGGNLNHFDGDLRLSVVGLTNNINIQNFAQEDLLGVASSGGNRRGGFGGRGGGGRGGRGGGSSVGDFLVNDQGGIATTHAGGINYSDDWGKKVEVSGSYFFNRSENVADQLLTQQFFVGGESAQLYDEVQNSLTNNTNHR